MLAVGDIGFRPKFDPRDVAHLNDIAFSVGADDDVAELFFRHETALDVDFVLHQVVTCLDTDRTGSGLNVLSLDRGGDF